MKYFRLKFSSIPVENEYKKIKEDNMKSFFKFLLYVLVVFTIIGIVQSVIAGSISNFISSSMTLIICTILLKYGHKIERCIDYILAILSLALYLMVIISSKKELDSAEEVSSLYAINLFYTGYVFGIFERLVILELARIELKLTFSLVSLVVRLIIWNPQQAFNTCYQIYTWCLCLFVDVRRERNDRTIFKSFYESREELVKFKNLMVSGLPINILILTRDMKRKLFFNRYFQMTFNIDPVDGAWNLHEWLNALNVEKDSLGEINIDSPYAEQNGHINLGYLLKTLSERQILRGESQSFTFNTKARLIGNTEDNIFGTKVFSLLWDGLEAVAIIMNDVTQQYTNLSLKVADKNKDKMIAMISHELKNPLNGIMGMIEIMEKKIQVQEILGYLMVCKQSGKLLINLVNSILDLAQIRNNKLKLNISKGSLGELLHEVYLLFELQFNQKDLDLKVHIEPGVDKFITTDLDRLRQVLINLIANALKFTFEGGVHVQVMKDGNREGNLLFKVSDTGVGIKEEEKNKLFKMYGRVDQAEHKVNVEGIGLGLTISNYIVRLLSGSQEEESIRVESVFGQGTSFTFSIIANMEISSMGSVGSDDDECNTKGMDASLCAEGNVDVLRRISTYMVPSDRQRNMARVLSQTQLYPIMSCKRRSSGARQGQQVDENEWLMRKSQFSGKVLLVDDSPFNILVARTLLETMGYEVQTALNGKIAVDIVEKASPEEPPFDIIIMDCQMPVMDGFEATSVLRQMMTNGKIPEMPIVALSANDSEDDKKRCKDVGMKEHISKPVSEAKIKSVLNKYCSKK